MAQFVLSQTVMGPQRVTLRTQSRSMAAAPLIARVSRQSRTARCVTRAAADRPQVWYWKHWVQGVAALRLLRVLCFLSGLVNVRNKNLRCVVL